MNWWSFSIRCLRRGCNFYICIERFGGCPNRIPANQWLVSLFHLEILTMDNEQNEAKQLPLFAEFLSDRWAPDNIYCDIIRTQICLLLTDARIRVIMFKTISSHHFENRTVGVYIWSIVCIPIIYWLHAAWMFVSHRCHFHGNSRFN